MNKNLNFLKYIRYFHAIKRGRSGKERIDSITNEILKEREQHYNKMMKIKEPNIEIIKVIKQLNLGKKRRARDNTTFHQIGPNKRYSTYLGSAYEEPWPVFKHMLPEIAFLGYSNVGKSTLINVLAGNLPHRGDAKVSDRAGWTNHIYFYKIGKKPPIMTFVDLPGYGHAVANPQVRKEWKIMIRNYLSTRNILSLCFILIDSTRGICEEDKVMLEFLDKKNLLFDIILTKCDLLKEDEIAKSIEVVNYDLKENINLNNIKPYIIPISSNTGGGINFLWNRCINISKQTSHLVKSVRIHKNAIK